MRRLVLKVSTRYSVALQQVLSQVNWRPFFYTTSKAYPRHAPDQQGARLGGTRALEQAAQYNIHTQIMTTGLVLEVVT